jgi:hypothetical protein
MTTAISSVRAAPRPRNLASAYKVMPTFHRIQVVDTDAAVRGYWVNSATIDAFVSRAPGGRYEDAVLQALDVSLEEQSLFDELEIDFVILKQYVEFFGLGYVRDVREPEVPEGNCEVVFSLDGPRLCLHALSLDGLTRIYLARDGRREKAIFRLEFFSPDGDCEPIKELEVDEDDIDEDKPRSRMLTWLIASQTSPLTPPPIES